MKTKTPSYQRHRFPSEIISHAVWLYHRFCLSFREVKELLAARGITIGIVMYGRSRECKGSWSTIALEVCRHVSGLFTRPRDRWP